jgi:hypothetical protein
MSKSLSERIGGPVLVLCAALALATLALPGIASAANCPNAEFRTGIAANLPDCRAYELATPVYKNAGEANVTGLSLGGESLFVWSRASLLPETGDNVGLSLPSHYLTARTAAGWTTTSVMPPAGEYESPVHGRNLSFQYLEGTSANGRMTLWPTRLHSQSPKVARLYLETAPGGPLVEVGPLSPPSYTVARPGIERGALQVVGYSQDMSHVLLGSNSYDLFFGDVHYWPYDETEIGEKHNSLYEYNGTGNTAPLLVGVNDEGKQISHCGIELGGPTLGSTSPVHTGLSGGAGLHNAVSADGSTIFFTARADASYGNDSTEKCPSTTTAPPVNELYARIDNGQPDAHTVAISEPAPTDCSACDTSLAARREGFRYLGASEDGTKVFFLSEQPLLGSDTSPNIYEYDFDGPPAGADDPDGRIVQISRDLEPSGEAQVQGIVQISEDGSHVYFVAKGVLADNPGAATEAATGLPQRAQAGAENMYVFDTLTNETKFIASLSAAEQDPELWGSGNSIANEISHLEPAVSDVTPEGRYLVFANNADLTPDDTSSVLQVFEYDAAAESLVRISIGQGGYNDDGNTDESGLEPGIVGPGYARENARAGYWEHMTMSADGSYVFFQSGDALTPQAVHDPRGRVKNVYEYHDGSVYLISDGQDTATGYGNTGEGAPNEERETSVVKLVGTDSSGADVYFRTQDDLVPQDLNGDPDIYDARIDGGIPLPPAPPECEGDSCQGPLSAAPVLLSPGSEFQAGTSSVETLTAPSPSTAKKTKPKQQKKKSKSRKGKRAKVQAKRPRVRSGKRRK